MWHSQNLNSPEAQHIPNSRFVPPYLTSSMRRPGPIPCVVLARYELSGSLIPAAQDSISESHRLQVAAKAGSVPATHQPEAHEPCNPSTASRMFRKLGFDSLSNLEALPGSPTLQPCGLPSPSPHFPGWLHSNNKLCMRLEAAPDT